MTDDDGYEDITKIEKLLSSEDREKRELGLMMVDDRYRKPICGRLRSRSGCKLPATDLPIIWQAVLETLFKFVENNKFQPRGEIGGLLWCFARWRAGDFVRERDKIAEIALAEYARAKAEKPQRRVDEAHRIDELGAAINDKLQRLTWQEQIVLKIYFEMKDDGVNLLLEDAGADLYDDEDNATDEPRLRKERNDRRPFLAKLTEAFNSKAAENEPEEYEKKSQLAVKSLLQRAMKKLREHLLREGHRYE